MHFGSETSCITGGNHRSFFPGANFGWRHFSTPGGCSAVIAAVPLPSSKARYILPSLSDTAATPDPMADSRVDIACNPSHLSPPVFRCPARCAEVTLDTEVVTSHLADDMGQDFGTSTARQRARLCGCAMSSPFSCGAILRAAWCSASACCPVMPLSGLERVGANYALRE